MATKSKLGTNPLLRQSRENLGLPDPTKSDSKPIPAFTFSMPKKFHFDAWLKNLIDSTIASVPNDKLLSTEAESLLTRFLAPLHTQLRTIAETTGNKISELTVTPGDSVYQIAHTEKLCQEMYTEETNAVNSCLKTILDTFDKDPAFKKSFMDAIKEPNEGKARDALVMRLKQEQESINNQKKSEDEIIDAITSWRILNAQAKYSAEVRRIIEESGDISVKSFKGTDVPDNVSFIPGKGKKFSMLDAFFKGDWSGVGKVYGIKNGKHTFDPRDPDACKTFVKFARAQNDGETTRVTIKLGGGTKSDYAMYGTLDANTSRVLHKRAMWFMATLKYGLEDIPSKTITKESILANYNKTGTIPEELKTVDLESPPIPIVEFLASDGSDKSGFTPGPQDKEEFKRWEGIREALLTCRLLEIEKSIEKIKATPAEQLTEQESKLLDTVLPLRAQLNEQLRKLEKLDTPAAPEQSLNHR